jgi:hypothetical protein
VSARDVGPHDGEIGLALVEASGALLRALGQDEAQADRGFLAVQTLR